MDKKQKTAVPDELDEPVLDTGQVGVVKSEVSTGGSRLRRSVERQTKRTLFLTISGIIVILVLLVMFGIPFLINLSLVFEKTKDTDTTQDTKSETYIQPPVLNEMFSATNSGAISVDGIADEGDSLILYVNDEKKEQIDRPSNKKFTFPDVQLDKGKNTIKVKALSDKDKSNFSNELTVSFIIDPPSLSIDEPPDGKTFSKDFNTANIKGKTDPKVKVTVNGFWAIVDSEGKYQYTLPLQNGENQIKIVATDEAGNKTEKEIKVTYSQ